MQSYISVNVLYSASYVIYFSTHIIAFHRNICGKIYIKKLDDFLPGTGGGCTGVGAPGGGTPRDEDGTHCLVGCIRLFCTTQLTALPPLCCVVPFKTDPTKNPK